MRSAPPAAAAGDVRACAPEIACVSRREALGACAAALGALLASRAAGGARCARAAAAQATFASADAPADEPPAWATFRDAWAYADVDADGSPEELELRDRRLRVTGEGSRLLLETDAAWQVSDVLVADFDGDGGLEVAFLLRRRGNYGDVRPFWESAACEGVGGAAGETPASSPSAAEGLTQHLFLYRWSEGAGGLRPAWMSSRLGVEAASVALEDAGGSARPHLRVTSPSGRATRWAWLGWGFAVTDDGGDGPDAAGTPATLSLVAVGDNVAHENVCEGAYDPATRSFDFSPCYERVRDRLGEFDVAAVCQETVLVANPARRSGYPRFATPQSMGDALAGAGFNLVLGATNHAADQGLDALADECAFWADEHPEVALAGLHASTADAGRPVVLGRAGVRFAAFDYAYGLNVGLGPDDAFRVDVLDDAGRARLLADVAATAGRGDADVVVVFLHIGEEYDPEPSAGQKLLAAELVDAGADVVICSHTHVRGPWGRLRTAAGREGVVFWGLGNFLSGQLADASTADGGAAWLRVEKAAGASARVADFGMLPLTCRADATGLPVVAFLE